MLFIRRLNVYAWLVIPQALICGHTSNFIKYKFKYILIETYYLDEIKNFFYKRGYSYVKKMSDRNDHLFKFEKLNKKNLKILN